MRCVSKCFIGNRSLRVYSLLLLGVVFGFSLSTIIHTFDVEVMRSTSRLAEQPALVAHRPQDAKQGSKVAFSNLPGRREVREEEAWQAGVEFGDYGYEREPEERGRVGEVKGERAGAALDATGEHRKPLPPAVKAVDSSLPPAPDAGAAGAADERGKHLPRPWPGRSMAAAADDDTTTPPESLSDELPSSKQTLLVGVITSVTQLMTQTLAIQGTWAPQASQIIYFVGEVDQMPHLPRGMEVVRLEGVDDQTGGWELKEISAVKHLIDHHLANAEWFMIVSDETYVAVETLEKQLGRLDARHPIYLGLADEASMEGGKDPLCRRDPGVVYSRALLEGVRPYLPMCWPGGQGEVTSLTGCVGMVGAKCTQAKEVRDNILFGSVQGVRVRGGR